MNPQKLILSALSLLFLAGFGVRQVDAQALCGPGYGTTPPGAICVIVTTNPPTTPEVRMGPANFPVPTIVAGDYEINIMTEFISTPNGMALTVAGTAERISNQDPASIVMVEIEGGRGTPLPASQSSLFLTGTTTGAGEVTMSAAAGFEFYNNDLHFEPIPSFLSYTANGPEAFTEFDNEAGVVDDDAVALRILNTFHIVNLNDVIDIPAGAGAGEPVFPPSSDIEMVLRLPVNGKMHHFPYEQFLIVNDKLQCPAGPYYGIHAHLNEAESLEGGTIQENSSCGVGLVSVVRTQTLGVIDDHTIIEESYTVPADEALLVTADGILETLPGTTLTVSPYATLTNVGEVLINGALVIDGFAEVDNRGQWITNDNTQNYGLFGICGTGTFENSGFFVNYNPATLFNNGEINNPGVICNFGTYDDNGQFSGNPVDPFCKSEEEEKEPPKG